MAEDDEQRLSHSQRLKAAVHYTVGKLCQEVTEDKQVNFSKHAVAAISEITFRQCETFAKDLELFARHGKRSAINMDDVKLLSRRSRALASKRPVKNERSDLIGCSGQLHHSSSTKVLINLPQDLNLEPKCLNCGAIVSRAAQYAHISAYSEEIAASNQEETEKRKKKSIGTGKRRSDGDSAVAEGEDME